MSLLRFYLSVATRLKITARGRMGHPPPVILRVAKLDASVFLVVKNVSISFVVLS